MLPKFKADFDVANYTAPKIRKIKGKVVTNQAIVKSCMSIDAKFLHIYLNSFSEDIKISESYLANNLNISIERLRKAKNELVKYKLLELVKTNTPRFKCEWILKDESGNILKKFNSLTDTKEAIKILENELNSVDGIPATQDLKNQKSLYIDTRTHARDNKFINNNININNINNNKFINSENKNLENLKNKEEKEKNKKENCVSSKTPSFIVDFSKLDEKDLELMATKLNSKQALKAKAIKAYKERNITNFSLDDWQMWVDYKLEKEKAPTMATFNHNLNQLVSFGSNAKQSISNSISSGWKGLFEVKNKTQYDKKGRKILSEEESKEVFDYILEMNGAKEEYYASLENKKALVVKRDNVFNGAF